MDAAKIVISILVLLLFFWTMLVALAGAFILFQMRRRHRAFLHIAMVKLGILGCIACTFISKIDVTQPGLHIVLKGWSGWWTIAAVLLVSVPLHGLVGYLLFGKTAE